MIKIQAEFENLNNFKHTSYSKNRRELDGALLYFILPDKKLATNLNCYDVSQEAFQRNCATKSSNNLPLGFPGISLWKNLKKTAETY